jgi:hypothetical protein
VGLLGDSASTGRELEATQKLLAYVIDLLGGSISLTPDEMLEIESTDYLIEAYEDQMTHNRTVRIAKQPKESVPSGAPTIDLYPVGFLLQSFAGAAAGSAVYADPTNPSNIFTVNNGTANPLPQNVAIQQQRYQSPLITGPAAHFYMDKSGGVTQLVDPMKHNQEVAQRALMQGGSQMDFRPNVTKADPTEEMELPF